MSQKKSPYSFRITEQMREDVVKCRAFGVCMETIITDLMETHAAKLESDIDKHGMQVIRKRISDLLRTCNPTSTKYSPKKYGLLYQKYTKAADVALQHEFREYFKDKPERVREQRDRIDKQIERLTAILDSCGDMIPENVAEYAQLDRQVIRRESVLTDVDRSLSEIALNLDKQKDKF